MRSISVEPEQLEACAARIDEDNQDYTRAYTQLFEAVDTMRQGGREKTILLFPIRLPAFSQTFGKCLCSVRNMQSS